MLHVRLVSPSELAPRVLGFLTTQASVTNVVHLRAPRRSRPEAFASQHPQTLFISRPDAYSAIVAFLAGAAGTISLTTSKSGALIGVLISVTTIPAAANVGVAAAYDNQQEIAGALAQLGINVAVLIVAGVVTLALQRLAFVRRLRHSLRRRRASRGQLASKARGGSDAR
jgi:uncharacterized hydrophobic protein (TIGR00271 family)